MKTITSSQSLVLNFLKKYGACFLFSLLGMFASTSVQAEDTYYLWMSTRSGGSEYGTWSDWTMVASGSDITTTGLKVEDRQYVDFSSASGRKSFFINKSPNCAFCAQADFLPQNSATLPTASGFLPYMPGITQDQTVVFTDSSVTRIPECPEGQSEEVVYRYANYFDYSEAYDTNEIGTRPLASITVTYDTENQQYHLKGEDALTLSGLSATLDGSTLACQLKVESKVEKLVQGAWFLVLGSEGEPTELECSSETPNEDGIYSCNIDISSLEKGKTYNVVAAANTSLYGEISSSGQVHDGFASFTVPQESLPVTFSDIEAREVSQSTVALQCMVTAKEGTDILDVAFRVYSDEACQQAVPFCWSNYCSPGGTYAPWRCVMDISQLEGETTYYFKAEAQIMVEGSWDRVLSDITGRFTTLPQVVTYKAESEDWGDGKDHKYELTLGTPRQIELGQDNKDVAFTIGKYVNEQLNDRYAYKAHITFTGGKETITLDNDEIWADIYDMYIVPGTYDFLLSKDEKDNLTLTVTSVKGKPMVRIGSAPTPSPADNEDVTTYAYIAKTGCSEVNTLRMYYSLNADVDTATCAKKGQYIDVTEGAPYNIGSYPIVLPSSKLNGLVGTNVLTIYVKAAARNDNGWWDSREDVASFLYKGKGCMPHDYVVSLCQKEQGISMLIPMQELFKPTDELKGGKDDFKAVYAADTTQVVSTDIINIDWEATPARVEYKAETSGTYLIKANTTCCGWLTAELKVVDAPMLSTMTFDPVASESTPATPFEPITMTVTGIGMISDALQLTGSMPVYTAGEPTVNAAGTEAVWVIKASKPNETKAKCTITLKQSCEHRTASQISGDIWVIQDAEECPNPNLSTK